MKDTKPGEIPLLVTPDVDKQGCGTSFLTGQRNEMDGLCGHATASETYVQPDDEKENGGEA